MKHSLALINIIEEGPRSASHYWDDEVFARMRPDIYREHVETFFAIHRAKESTKSLWYKALTWLRGWSVGAAIASLPKSHKWTRSGGTSTCGSLVSRRPTSTGVRVTLPLENEIPLFMKALGPQFTSPASLLSRLIDCYDALLSIKAQKDRTPDRHYTSIATLSLLPCVPVEELHALVLCIYIGLCVANGKRLAFGTLDESTP